MRIRANHSSTILVILSMTDESIKEVFMQKILDMDDFHDLQKILDQPPDQNFFSMAMDLQTSEERARKHEIYYYLLRNSILLFPEAEEDLHQIELEEKELFRLLVFQAFSLAKQEEKGSIHHPWWIENIYEEVLQYNQDAQFHSIIKATEIHLKAQAGIGITVKSNGSIYFSLLTKTFLKNYLTAVFTLIEYWQPDAPEENIQKVFDTLFPFFLYYCYPINMNLSILPRIRIMDQDLYYRAKNTAHYQAMFLFLHETAHFGLGHIGKKEIGQNVFLDGFRELHQKDKHYKEYEADAIATLIMQEFPSSKINAIRLAIHSLFEFYTTEFKFQQYILEQKKDDKQENPFAKRYAILASIPTTQPTDPDTRSLMQVISHVYHLFLSHLYAMEPQALEEKIIYYTKQNPVKQSFDRFTNPH